jgi:hypothetical protein
LNSAKRRSKKGKKGKKKQKKNFCSSLPFLPFLLPHSAYKMQRRLLTRAALITGQHENYE